MVTGTAADASVRTAAAGDVAAIAAVQSRAWRTAYRDLLDDETLAALTPQSLAEPWRSAVTAPPSPRHTVLVACAGDLVVGFAAAAPSEDRDAEDTDGELVALVVDPAHQGTGHGSRLLSAVAQHLLDSGSRTIAAWTPEDDGPRRAFLASAGLQPDGARRGYGEGRPGEVRYRAALTGDEGEHTAEHDAGHTTPAARQAPRAGGRADT